MGRQSRPPLALMSQSVTKEQSQHTKPTPQMHIGAMYAQLMSDWKQWKNQHKGHHFLFMFKAIALDYNNLL